MVRVVKVVSWGRVGRDEDRSRSDYFSTHNTSTQYSTMNVMGDSDHPLGSNCTWVIVTTHSGRIAHGRQTRSHDAVLPACVSE